MAYLTEMRIGERSAIQFKDIYQNKENAKVCGTLIKKVGVGLVKQPFTKPKSSNCDVALPDREVEIYLRKCQSKNSDSFFTNKKQTIYLILQP